MRKLFFLSLCLLLAGVTACSSKGKALAKVGGDLVYESDIAKIIASNPRLAGAPASDDLNNKILEKYIEQTLLYQESLRRGLHRQKEVKERLELAKMGIVAMASVEDEIEKKSREYYDNHPDEFNPLEIAHIFVALQGEKDKKKTAGHTEKQALEIIGKAKARLDKGEDFASVAKELSEDKRSSVNGGSLGKVTLADRNLQRLGWTSLIEKALPMTVGSVSEPIKTAGGYHIIKLLAGKTLQPFDQVKEQIQFRVQGQARAQLLADLKKKTKIKMMNEKSEEAAKAAPSTPAAAPQSPPPAPAK